MLLALAQPRACCWSMRGEKLPVLRGIQDLILRTEHLYNRNYLKTKGYLQHFQVGVSKEKE